MSETVHTSIALALISGVAMAVIGLIFSRWSLEVMGTPEDVIAQATLYMQIYFLGMPFFMVYNYGAAILRAVGDTKRPLFYLIISGVINAVLNMILVIFLSYGGGRCCHCNGHFAADFMYSGTAVSVSVRGKLSVAILKTDHEKSLSDADLSGRCSGGHPEYGY